MTAATPAAAGARGARGMPSAAPAPARLRLADLARLSAVGLATRKLRAALSALGIAIGVAAIVAVLGLSSSSAAGLNAEIAALGTNLLTVQNGQTLSGGTAELPNAAPGMIARLPGVTAVQDTGTVNGVSAYSPRSSPRSKPTRSACRPPPWACPPWPAPASPKAAS
jgi:putative ABC transport system permease protein